MMVLKDTCLYLFMVFGYLKMHLDQWLAKNNLSSEQSTSIYQWLTDLQGEAHLEDEEDNCSYDVLSSTGDMKSRNGKVMFKSIDLLFILKLCSHSIMCVRGTSKESSNYILHILVTVFKNNIIDTSSLLDYIVLCSV